MSEKEKIKAGYAIKAICIAGTAALAFFFLMWYGDGTGKSTPGVIAAVVSVLCFELLCLRFVSGAVWFCLAQPLPSIDESESPEPEHMGIKIFAALLAVNVAVLVAVYLIRRCTGSDDNFWQGLQFWRCLDSQSYLNIAEDWYLSQGSMDRLVQLVFLPGYPLAIRLVNVLVGDYLYSSILLSLLCFSGAGCLVYRLLRLDYPHQTAQTALCFLCVIPGAFFFAAPMSESLFLLLCAACLLCARKSKWLSACLLAALASFTRSLGLTLMVPLVMELIRDSVSSLPMDVKHRRKLLLRSLALLLIPLGFAAYCLINYQVSGDPFKFMEYQRDHWSQQLGWFFNTASYQTDWAIFKYTESIHDFLGLWLPNLISIFLCPLLFCAAAKKVRPSYTGWFIGYYVIAVGATWLLSAPRYMAAFLPLPLALSLLCRRPWPRRLLWSLCLVAELLYMYAFALRWQVW